MRATFLLVAIGISIFAGTAAAQAADGPPCGSAYQEKNADVDGPVLSVTDAGQKARPGAGRYHIIVRDHFTNCRVSDDTDTECKVGQQASIAGGSFGIYVGDVKDTDTDYQYAGMSHLWNCGP